MYTFLNAIVPEVQLEDEDQVVVCVSSFSGVSLSLSVFYLAAKLLERSISKLNHENDKKA